MRFSSIRVVFCRRSCLNPTTLLYRGLCQYTAISWDIVYRHWIGFNYIKYWRGGSRPEPGSTLQIRPYTGEHCVNCCPQLSTPCLEPIQAVWRGCLWHKLFLIFPYIDSANMASSCAPKQWCLTKTETANSIEVITSVGHTLRLPNLTGSHMVIKKHDHFCQVHQIFPSNPNEDSPHSDNPLQPTPSHNNSNSDHLLVSIDPDGHSISEEHQFFEHINHKYHEAFNAQGKAYNGRSGPIQAIVNMGPVQPLQRKGKIPLYGCNHLVELQEHFDELERDGVFAKPEDVGVNVEYLNPSFLINKPGGGTRLVTAFADVGRYCKPQPSLLPDVDSTLQKIADWRYIIQTDLKSAFYQIPLAKESMKYCGVVTPFQGTRVYTRCAIGMPGSEVALEELMCRIMGSLVMEGSMAKIVDDMYIGGNSIPELADYWEQFLSLLVENNLGISAPKTKIAPMSTVILGWVWNNGSLSASTHRITTLSTCSRPVTVKDMRSFLGAYRFLVRLLPKCAQTLAPLEEAVSGRESREKIDWSAELEHTFNLAQAHLQKSSSINLPQAADQLWIVTDASVKAVGLAATLCMMRHSKLHLSGHFSARLRYHQRTWFPCELEALAIAASVKHFSPYIIQSHKPVCALTDSKPCVEAVEKLCRGEFSATQRVATFLSMVSRFQVSIRHLAGTSNAPSDFGSRNAPSCTEEHCQICVFIHNQQDATVLHVAVQDVLSGGIRLHFSNRTTWLSLQSECPDMRRTHAHLKQGTRPSQKLTNLGNVKRYLRIATIASDGLLVVRQQNPLSHTR